MVTAALSIGCFFGGFWLSGVSHVAADVLTTTQQAAAVMRDPDLDDSAREKAIQRSSLRLLSSLVSIVVRSAAAVAAAVAPIYLAHAAGFAQADRVFGLLSRWETALVTTVVAVVAYGVRMQPWRTS